MNFLRFLLLLSVAVWLGGLVFFPVVAQSAFSTLPSQHLAGLVVRDSLLKLHWIGLICGVVFLACSLIHDSLALGRVRLFPGNHILIVTMLVLTAISQFRIIPRMDTLRAAAGDISALASNNAIRIQFDSLHTWSVRLEEMVLVCGLVVLYQTACRFSAPR